MRLLLIILLLCSTASAEPEKCQRFWNLKEEVKPIPFVTQRRRIPSYVKRWRSLIAHSPRNVKKHFYYRANRRIRPTTTWGNFGWEKSLSTWETRIDRAWARLFALGGNVYNLSDAAALTEDIDQHYRFAREHRCLNRWKDIHRSFMESIKIREFSRPHR